MFANGVYSLLTDHQQSLLLRSLYTDTCPFKIDDVPGNIKGTNIRDLRNSPAYYSELCPFKQLTFTAGTETGKYSQAYVCDPTHTSCQFCYTFSEQISGAKVVDEMGNQYTLLLKASSDIVGSSITTSPGGSTSVALSAVMYDLIPNGGSGTPTRVKVEYTTTFKVECVLQSYGQPLCTYTNDIMYNSSKISCS